jgi:hypothetical protein
VTIDEGGEQSAVDIAGNCHVIRLGQKVTHRLIAIPITFDVMSMLVQFAASVAVGENVWIVVLEGGLSHGTSFWKIREQ